jgi:hypothetical protein
MRRLLVLLAAPALLAGAAPADARRVDVARAAGLVAVASVDGTRHRVELRRSGSARVLFRRSARTRRFVRPQVELTRRGTLVYALDGRVVSRTRGGAVRRIGSGGMDLTVDETGTARWGPYDGPELRDVDPAPVRDGCPARAGFTALPAPGPVRLTRRTYRDEYATEVVRACLPGAGGDVVVGTGYGLDSDMLAVTAVGTTTPFVVVRAAASDKYDGCSWTTLTVVDVRTAAVARQAELPPGYAPGDVRACTADLLAPRAEDPLAVTTAGAVAWLRDGVLRGIRADRRVVELDRGAVTDLTAAGQVVRWRRDGVDRSATL